MSLTPIACPGCDALYRIDPAREAGSAECPRCGAVLWREGKHSQEGTFALVLGSLVLFLIAQAFPLMSFQLQGGLPQQTTIPGCVALLVRTGWPWLAAVLMVTVILSPLAYLGGLAFVMAQLHQGWADRFTARVFRIIHELEGWAMVEVFLLGALVSYVKLSKMAIVVPGPALFALAGSVLMAVWAAASMDTQAIWAALGGRR